MPFLVVLGDAAWRSGPHFFRAGVHEIDEEIADRARARSSKSLLVLDERPVLAEKHDGPLTLEDLKVGVRGVQLKLVEPEPEPEPDPEQVEVDHVFRCAYCPDDFPSAPALARHVELNHDLA